MPLSSSASLESATTVACRRCGKPIPAQVPFCSFCGSAQQYTRVPARGWLGIVCIGLAIAALLWTVQKRLAGNLPSQIFSGTASDVTHMPDLSAAAALDQQSFAELRKAAQANPDSLEAWSALTSALLNQVQSNPDASQELLFEAIEALKQILRIDPNNQAALLSMAEISFRRQVFDKAAEFYQRYLAERPEDLRARARLGSTYTFMNKPTEAETELRKVLSVDQQHFEANAYLAIVLMQAGRRDEAQQFGATALQHAPNDDSRSRLAAFLGTPTAGEEADSLTPVREFLRAHPIAGPKLSQIEMVEGTVRIHLRDFPMQAMPQAIRDKFAQEVLSKVGQATPVEFIDAETGAVLHSVK